MKLVFLGTASCFPTPTRGVSCTALQLDDGQVWIFDCGEGSQIQLQRSSIKAGKISKIFITHLHGDHLYGLPGLLCTLGNGIDPERASDTVIELYGPVGLRKYLTVSLGLSRSPLAFQLSVTELEPRADQLPADWTAWPVEQELQEPPLPQEAAYRRVQGDGAGRWPLLEAGHITVMAAALAHRVPSFGFLVTEAAAPGRLDTDRLLARGVRPGPVYGKLKAGQTVQLDGELLRPEEFLGPEVAGRRLAVLGDTSDSSELVQLVGEGGLDVLVHEATMENRLQEKAISFGHSTPGMAARVAEQCGARHLVLTHLSPRYKPVSLCGQGGEPDSALVIVQEAREELDRLGREGVELTVAEDFTEVTIPKRTVKNVSLGK